MAVPILRVAGSAALAGLAWAIVFASALTFSGQGRADDAASSSADRAAKADLERLQGAWVCTEMAFNGKDLPVKELKKSALPNDFLCSPIIRGNYWMGTGSDGKSLKRFLSIKLVPGGEPRQIDLIRLDREEVLAGIYKLDGDILTLCVTVDRDTPMRPTRFVTKKDLPMMLFVYERKHPEAGQSTSTPTDRGSDSR